MHKIEDTPNNSKHQLKLLDIRLCPLPSTPSAAAPTSGIRPVTTPGTPVRVTAPTAPAAGPPRPARVAPVPASRAKPPERSREESDNYSEIFQNINNKFSKQLSHSLTSNNREID